jgi:hypothetical protein
VQYLPKSRERAHRSANDDDVSSWHSGNSTGLSTQGLTGTH